MLKKDGLIVSKSCVQPVYMLRVGRGREHNLCAGWRGSATPPAYNHSFIRRLHTPKPLHYPQGFRDKTPLLSLHFSPLYTGPIKTITTYINKYLDNTRSTS
jgi:hypothetical protein